MVYRANAVKTGAVPTQHAQDAAWHNRNLGVPWQAAQSALIAPAVWSSSGRCVPVSDFDAGLRGVRVDVERGDHPAVAVPQRHRDRADAGR